MFTGKELLKLPVFTENGVFLGKVKDFEFDPVEQRIKKYFVKKSFCNSNYLIDSSQVLEISPQKMLVQDCISKESNINDLKLKNFQEV